MKRCDFCGKPIIGTPFHPVNENFVPQDLNMCKHCYADSLKENEPKKLK